MVCVTCGYDELTYAKIFDSDCYIGWERLKFLRTLTLLVFWGATSSLLFLDVSFQGVFQV